MAAEWAGIGIPFPVPHIDHTAVVGQRAFLRTIASIRLSISIYVTRQDLFPQSSPADRIGHGSSFQFQHVKGAAFWPSIARPFASATSILFPCADDVNRVKCCRGVLLCYTGDNSPVGVKMSIVIAEKH